MIVLAETGFGERQAKLGHTFACITRPNPPHIYMSPIRGQIFFILGIDPDLHRPGDARQGTRVPYVKLNYFEVWDEISGSRRYSLNKAYMHIFEQISPEDEAGKEVLALHCDIKTHPEEASYIYKRGPHIHVSGWDHPCGRSHIALCLQNLEKTCGELSTFDEAFKLAVRMVDEEFLARLK